MLSLRELWSTQKQEGKPTCLHPNHLLYRLPALPGFWPHKPPLRRMIPTEGGKGPSSQRPAREGEGPRALVGRGGLDLGGRRDCSFLCPFWPDPKEGCGFLLGRPGNEIRVGSSHPGGVPQHQSHPPSPRKWLLRGIHLCAGGDRWQPGG